ncbi:MAG TPA: hypothetical protein DEF22_05845 [Leclercia adecarboxylata]|nr:hypothetical protein [Leclercia adecarboxylata]
MMPANAYLAIPCLRLCNECNKIAIVPVSAAPPGKTNRTKFTINCRFFSKNDSALTMLFNSFIKIPPPEILPS